MYNFDRERQVVSGFEVTLLIAIYGLIYNFVKK
jgi:hypothetical protein